jgi:TatA/E family protein of Tat protein translocase
MAAHEQMGIENPVHLIFLGAVALIVLGPKRLPELARALGKGIREFRQAINVGETTGPQAHDSQTQLLHPAPLHVGQPGESAEAVPVAAHPAAGFEAGASDVEPAAGPLREEDRGLT